MIVAILAGSPPEVREGLAALAARRVSVPGELAAEVRLDLMDPPDPSVCKDAPLPVVATCRRPHDGGRFRCSEPERLDLLRRAAEAGATWVDVEVDALESWRPAGRARLVASYHDFEATPPDLPSLVNRLLGSDAPMVKVATRVRNLLDVITLAAAAREAPGRVIAVGMGSPGAAQRILADRTGSAWTYARLGTPQDAVVHDLGATGVPELGELVEFHRGGRWDRETPAFAVIGDRADESIGPKVFNRVFREAGVPGTYVHLKAPSLAGLREVCRLLNLRGLSVTTPFKELVLAAADVVDERARAIGAANTLALTDGRWVASNTDRLGIAGPVGAWLAAKGRPAAGLSALVAGAGGMGRAAAAALRGLGCRVALTSRGPDRLRRAADALEVERLTLAEAGVRKWDVMVNATPAGSVPRDPNGRAIEAAWGAPGGLVVETNYRQGSTPLVRQARARGLDAIGGDAVYVAQATAQMALFAPAIGDAAARIEAATAWALSQTASS
jgi:3-dehydroquinate dehydratase / shikimate dehydrogenase